MILLTAGLWYANKHVVRVVLTGKDRASGRHFGSQPECIPLIKFYLSFFRIHGSFNGIKAAFVVFFLVPLVFLVIHMVVWYSWFTCFDTER